MILFQPFIVALLFHKLLLQGINVELRNRIVAPPQTHRRISALCNNKTQE